MSLSAHPALAILITGMGTVALAHRPVYGYGFDGVRVLLRTGTDQAAPIHVKSALQQCISVRADATAAAPTITR